MGIWVGVWILLLTACDTAPHRLLRLGSLVEVEKTAAAPLPPGTSSPEAPYQVRAGLNASRIARLRLRARGTASLATLAW